MSSDAWASILEALMEAAASVLAADSLDETMKRVADRLVDLVPYDDLTLYAIDHERGLLVPAFACGSFVDEVMADSFPVDEGITGATLASGKARNIPRIDLEPGAEAVEGTELDPESAVVLPLTVEGRAIGALNVYRAGKGAAFTPQEFHVIERFGVMAALAFESARHRHQLREQASTDPLTGLLNRRAFGERLEDALATPRDRGDTFLVLVDVDHFKAINDSYGHAMGDQTLEAVAAAMRSALREGDTIGRLGGEEFAFVLRDTDFPTALAVTERVRSAVRDLRVVDHDVTVSAGLAQVTSTTATTDDLMKTADDALYAAKRGGRNRTCCATGT